MAASTGRDGKSVCSSDVDLLLHPELLSQEFMQLVLQEKNVSAGDCGSRDRLTELYLRHIIPLPQRTLPNSRWGRRVDKIRGRPAPAAHRPDSSSNDHNRKRPLVVFDGSSSQSGPLKVKKPEGSTVSTGITDRLKPPPAANLSNPIRKLSGSTSSSSSSIHRSTDATNLKREANSSGTLKSPEVKKKIQHVTWP
ncbi:ashwin isoform X2 [Mastacembelus armatus]|uniref:ashwin isoform X2 n=1 Tax=Mastacembelus armatus TaxID=205130 RepID=UPI000E4653F5|nr:ashwin isoform X2 [Mastacembelus armatus]